MMKSFIIAATSIAYILSISSIADAKVAKINKSVDRGQSCQTPVNLNSQYNQLAKDNAGLNKDMEIICQLINKKYAKINESGLDDEGKIQPQIAKGKADPIFVVTGFTTLKEVKSIKIIAYEKTTEKTANLSMIIEVADLSYVWRNNK